MTNQDRLNHRLWREFVQVTGVPPPKLQCPGGMLSPLVTERLAGRGDLIDWALGRLAVEEEPSMSAEPSLEQLEEAAQMVEAEFTRPPRTLQELIEQVERRRSLRKERAE